MPLVKTLMGRYSMQTYGRIMMKEGKLTHIFALAIL